MSNDKEDKLMKPNNSADSTDLFKTPPKPYSTGSRALKYRERNSQIGDVVKLDKPKQDITNPLDAFSKDKNGSLIVDEESLAIFIDTIQKLPEHEVSKKWENYSSLFTDEVKKNQSFICSFLSLRLNKKITTTKKEIAL